MDTKGPQHDILKGYNMLLYFTGSMIMHEPSEECITDFWTKGILKNLPVSSLNPNFIQAASQLRESCAEKTICVKIVDEDYIRLFARQELPLAPAYESLYRKKGDLNSDHHSASVTKFYNSYGWESKFKGKIKDDHLGIELLFLTLLIDRYMVLDDEACRVEMRKEIRRFIDYHILSWIPEWNKKVQVNANTLCFKGIGTLILACIEDLYSLMSYSNNYLN
ncbi:MAG: molecular chaperone TorD family protein [Bacteroidia bacterium]|nr:molecular chaperone TorD family protein [Bacteroidia bacterium]